MEQKQKLVSLGSNAEKTEGEHLDSNESYEEKLQVHELEQAMIDAVEWEMMSDADQFQESYGEEDDFSEEGDVGLLMDDNNDELSSSSGQSQDRRRKLKQRIDKKQTSLEKSEKEKKRRKKSEDDDTRSKKSRSTTRSRSRSKRSKKNELETYKEKCTSYASKVT